MVVNTRESNPRASLTRRSDAVVLLSSQNGAGKVISQDTRYTISQRAAAAESQDYQHRESRGLGLPASGRAQMPRDAQEA